DPPADHPPVDIGGGLVLPVYRSGPDSQAWWAIAILMMVAGSLYGCLLFSYLYLWTVSPQLWPGGAPHPAWTAAVAALLLLSSGAVAWANRRVTREGRCGLLLAAVPLLVAAVTANFLAHAALEPAHTAYGAIVYAVLCIDAFFAAVAVTLALYAVARRLAGRLDRVRR